jgi:adenine-specific DNA-methyltransferase
MASLIENDEVLWPPKRTGRPRRKKFAKDIGSEFTGLSTVLETVYSTQGTRELRDIFDGKELFDFPKPVDYIKLIIEQGSSMNSTILDFFAGSGTTLHATMQLNAEDGGHRQCILVTNNENGICENVTYERNKRVIQGYTTPKGEHVAGLAKNNLRYYKADFISRETNSRNKRNLVKAATDLLCIKENLYEEIKITCNGKTLRKNYARRFADSEKEMIIIYEPAVIKYIVEELKTWGQKESIKIYVFSDGRYAYDDDFKDVIDKVTLCALPDAIYQAYRRVLPQRKKAQQAGTMVDNEEMKEALADAEQYSYKEEKGGES